jgi:predicted DNA repair protein MutK
MTEDWWQIIVMIGSQFLIFLSMVKLILSINKTHTEDTKAVREDMRSFTAEIREDMRSFTAEIREDMRSFTAEIRGWRNETNKEMKDFHERLLKIEMERK